MPPRQDGTGTSDVDRILAVCGGFRAARALHAAVALGVPDALRDGPRSASRTAAAVGAEPDALGRLLRALTSVGVVRATPAGEFGLTSAGLALTSDAPGSLAPYVLLELGDHYHDAWGRLADGVRTGTAPFELAHGKTPWEVFEGDPEASRTLGGAMAALTHDIARRVLDAYDLSPFTRFVDVGGNEGDFLEAVLSRFPEAEGVLLDLPHVVENARKRGHPALTSRGTFSGGDFFRDVPAGGDVYFLKWVLHDWDDGKCRTILRNCRRALDGSGSGNGSGKRKGSGRLLVVNAVLPPDDPHHPALLSDLGMLVLGGGRERTLGEFEALFADAGLRVLGVTRLGQRDSLIEVAPH